MAGRRRHAAEVFPSPFIIYSHSLCLIQASRQLTMPKAHKAAPASSSSPGREADVKPTIRNSPYTPPRKPTHPRAGPTSPHTPDSKPEMVEAKHKTPKSPGEKGQKTVNLSLPLHRIMGRRDDEGRLRSGVDRRGRCHPRRAYARPHQDAPVGVDQGGWAHRGEDELRRAVPCQSG